MNEAAANGIELIDNSKLGCRCVASAFPIPNEANGRNMTHRIQIEPTTIRGERGQYYRVHYEGAVLIDETWNPELEACRALLARGIVGRLEVWRSGKSHPDMLVPDITKAAQWSVEESGKRGPHFVRWRPRPEDVPRNAVSSSAPFPPAAVLGSGDPYPTQERNRARRLSERGLCNTRRAHLLGGCRSAAIKGCKMCRRDLLHNVC
jgi:hypothetical protein